MRNFLMLAALALASDPASTSIAQSATSGTAPRKEILRTDKTISGQSLKFAQGKSEMVASVADFAPNGVTAVHKHPWSRIVYVERGPLRVTNFDRHRTDVFQTGQVFVEAVDEWHQGHAGPQGARLVVFDLVPPGTNNVINR